ncbi:LamG domain-containing protein [Povalibacter sp.]|uniref:LamG domain-containing protein n=1 Tax=Povalibacter sp. TaxID=1962978 RepID=UPI002D1FA373|nr:LamG domain-containing protein [Povalibacter sp.]
MRVMSFRVLRITLATLSAAFIVGCSGGADTVENSPTGGTAAPSSYSGPQPTNADIQAFRVEFWENVRATNRCGSCHAAQQTPTFARSDDVNAAYQQMEGLVNRTTPSQSSLVLKVGGGHNCWLPDAGACASILTRWITAWVGASDAAGRQIQLLPPTPKDPGETRRFPTTAPGEFTALWTLLRTTGECAGCHRSNSPTAQSPYFASDNQAEAYLAAMPKINLDNPAASRFVVRLRNESHNCWSASCANDAQAVQNAITAMAAAIPVTRIDPALVVSKALTLFDGTVASGGNRYENNLIALYEFQTGSGATAYDTSGVSPAADLQFSGDVSWVGGWGINIKAVMNGGSKAQASTTASRKFQEMIGATGEYSIEAWVAPGNVTQEEARIVSYSGSNTTRNFTMGQTMYNYEFFNRSTATNNNGGPLLTTDPDDERLQSSLQHVVMTFDPVNGRRIYVNGEFTGDLDSAGGGTLGEWDNSFAFALGNEVSSDPDHQWTGVIRLAAVHKRALTLAQIRQNFEAGVGQKFFLLFGVGHLIDMPQSYVMFEVTQYDSSGYLFTNPKFISLDPAARPGSIALQGMRIGLNGAEPIVGQAYRLLDVAISDTNYSAETGQALSSVGTIIPVEQGPASDEFFLCFDRLGSRTNVCSQFAAAVLRPVPLTSRPADIGVRTFDQINATMASVTGVSPNTASVRTTFDNVRASLPATPSIEAFLSSHQTSIAQLALVYCSALVDDANARQDFFGSNLSGLQLPAARDTIIAPIVAKAIGAAQTQPSPETTDELRSLVGQLCPTNCSGARSLAVTKAVCGAALGSAAMLVQ